MRIVVLGAGQVGASVAEALASEANDITIVDQNRAALGDLADRLDVRTVVGNASLPSVLRSAGLDDADMLVAVTQSDQTNLVASKIARSLFNVSTRIARLRSADFLNDPALLADENFAVTHAICPEQEITDYIARLIEFPEALQVLEFADGQVTLVDIQRRVPAQHGEAAGELGTVGVAHILLKLGATHRAAKAELAELHCLVGRAGNGPQIKRHV